MSLGFGHFFKVLTFLDVVLASEGEDRHGPVRRGADDDAPRPVSTDVRPNSPRGPFLFVIACSLAAWASAADADRILGMRPTHPLFVLIQARTERLPPGRPVGTTNVAPAGQVAAQGGPTRPVPIQAALDS